MGTDRNFRENRWLRPHVQNWEFSKLTSHRRWLTHGRTRVHSKGCGKPWTILQPTGIDVGVQVGPKPNDNCPHERHTEERQRRWPCDDGGRDGAMWSRAQGCWSPQKLDEAGKTLPWSL